MGVHIICALLVLSLLEEFAAPNFIRAALKVAVLVPFLMMYVKDTAMHRWLVLNVFCLVIPLIAIVNLIAYQNILIDNVAGATQLCWLSKKWTHFFGSERDKVEADPCDTNDNEENADECAAEADQCPVLPGGMLKVLFVITPIIVVMNIHFAFVLYTHWKNSRLPESDGGCKDEDGPEEDDFTND